MVIFDVTSGVTVGPVALLVSCWLRVINRRDPGGNTITSLPLPGMHFVGTRTIASDTDSKRGATLFWRFEEKIASFREQPSGPAISSCSVVT
jgi:hypothetical protein